MLDHNNAPVNNIAAASGDGTTILILILSTFNLDAVNLLNDFKPNGEGLKFNYYQNLLHIINGSLFLVVCSEWSAAANSDKRQEGASSEETQDLRHCTRLVTFSGALTLF
jgi:hypothetical protein